MKKILIILSLFALFACQEELDLRPPQNIDTDVATSTDANVKSVLVGAYNALSDGTLFGGQIHMYSELLGADGEFQFSGTFGGPSEIWRKEITTVNADITSVWLDGFNVINITNTVLANLEVVNEADRELVEGEARFLRGLVYFELAKYYGLPYSAGNVESNLAVPIVLTPTDGIGEENFPERATVEQVYQQALTDLSTAENLLPATNGEYANSVAAAGILSRIYLQMGRYEDARDAANRGINAAQGIYSLVANYEDAFNQTTNTTEDVFAIQVNTQDGSNNMHLFFASPLLNGRGDVEILQPHIDFYDPNDERLDLFYVDGSTGDLRTGKWTNQFGNVVALRLAELYLTRAEANLRLGTNIGDTPANDLDLIRNRVNLPRIDNPTLDDILLERKLELAFEGRLIHDIKRLQGSADGFTYNANELVFPVPQREMDVNDNLVQNPGYGNN